MKKKANLLACMAIALMIIFGIVVLIDSINYDEMINSAPFETLALVRFLEFMVPSIILVIIARNLKKKGK